jgi:hypothetical protein
LEEKKLTGLSDVAVSFPFRMVVRFLQCILPNAERRQALPLSKKNVVGRSALVLCRAGFASGSPESADNRGFAVKLIAMNNGRADDCADCGEMD